MVRRCSALAFGTALLLTTTAAFAQSPSFGARDDVAAAHAPRAIVAADVTGDGFPDLILGGTNPGTITILPNFGKQDGNEGQRFRPATQIAVGGGPFDLAVGDLNRDGKADIAVANADSNAITLLLGTGNGNFAPPVDVAVADNPRGIALGDFNRDGILDIIVTKYMGSTLDVLYGAGDGTFPTRKSFAAPTNAQGVAVGDFNNDGWLDAAVASVNGTVSIYSMSATGAARHDLHPTSDGWNVIAAVDLDGDGRQDVALASTASSQVEVLYNRASGWTASTPVPVAASPRGIAAGDLNADGRPDLAVAGRSASMVSVVTRAADGTLSSTDFPSGSGARAVALADFSPDGKLDIVTANEFGNSATVLYDTLALPAAAFAFERTAVPDEPGLNQVFGVGDFNHNGIPDLVQSEGILLDGKTHSRMLGRSWTEGAAAADFNGDGNLDVAYATDHIIQVFFGDGQGGFTDGPAMQVPSFPGRMRTADINRDGRPDLVVLTAGTPPDGAAIYLGQGNGTFTKSATLSGGFNWLELGDLDRDGIVDIAAASVTDGVHVFLGDGKGGVKSTHTYGAGTPRYGFALGDVNEDGILDLAVADGVVGPFGPEPSSRLTVARGHGDGTFETLQQYETADSAGDQTWIYGVVIGDLNADGHPDIFTSNADLLAGTGEGDFGPPQRFAGIATGASMLTDVNGDGLLDALGYFETDTGGTSVIMMNTRRDQNRPPAGLLTRDTVLWPYEQTWSDQDENGIDATSPANPVIDPDMHRIQFRWTLPGGQLLSTAPTWIPKLNDGSYQVTLSASDARGGVVSDAFTLNVPPFKETVLLPASDGQVYGAWQVVPDPTASGGYRVSHPNANAPKQTAALANPTNYFEIGFLADPSQDYKLWIRLKAENDNWANDSVFVQFTGATDASGNPVYQIGTTSALAVNLEECSNCGVSGWGWEDDGWGAVNVNGTTLHFPAGGPQTIRVQTREDGVSIDQIVLSSEKYKTTRPGTAKNDTLKLNHTGPYLVPHQPF